MSTPRQRLPPTSPATAAPARSAAPRALRVTAAAALRAAAVAALVLVAPHAARASDPAAGPSPTTHFPDPATGYARFRWYGEVSQFSIRILGTEAVRAGVQVGYVAQDQEFGSIVPINIVGTTVGFFHTIYPINNQALSLLGVHEGLRAVFTDSDYNERDYVTRIIMTYDRPNYALNHLRISPDKPDERRRIVIPRELYDDLSMVFDLRSRDLRIGDTYVYYNHDGELFDRFAVTVTGTESVYTPMGHIDAYVIQWVGETLESHPVLPFGDVALPPTFRTTTPPTETARSFISTDERRLLVGADIPTSIGNMTIRLADYTGPNTAYVAPARETLP